MFPAVNTRDLAAVQSEVEAIFSSLYPEADIGVISRAFANEGPRWKRFRAAAFGRASRILKRTTHITVELEKKT